MYIINCADNNVSIELFTNNTVNSCEYDSASCGIGN